MSPWKVGHPGAQIPGPSLQWRGRSLPSPWSLTAEEERGIGASHPMPGDGPVLITCPSPSPSLAAFSLEAVDRAF